VIYLNGKPREHREGATVREILESAGLDPALAVVTLDGTFVPPSDYGRIRPAPGARLAARKMMEGG
jgi:thiamine biosynthesis protein ThiS